MSEMPHLGCRNARVWCLTTNPHFPWTKCLHFRRQVLGFLSLRGVAKQFSQDSGLSRWRLPVGNVDQNTRFLHEQSKFSAKWGFRWAKSDAQLVTGHMTSLASPINHMLWEAVSGPYTHLPKKYMVKTSSLSLRDNGGYDSLKACNFFGHASCRVIGSDQRLSKNLEFWWVSDHDDMPGLGQPFYRSHSRWTKLTYGSKHMDYAIKAGPFRELKSGIYTSLFCPKQVWIPKMIRFFGL